jgi:hypothetical protein
MQIAHDADNYAQQGPTTALWTTQGRLTPAVRSIPSQIWGQGIRLQPLHLVALHVNTTSWPALQSVVDMGPLARSARGLQVALQFVAGHVSG